MPDFEHGYYLQGASLRRDVRWPGRAFATEVGPRAYYWWSQEVPGEWPSVLNDFERLLMDAA